ncbi:MAG: hypothetical protein Solivirus1_42 [Solivirus sp.]|uniref:Ankyrin repeat protein n=1 Tax=Solivirus sp. TaxID=2487772 RepID=A0A3G5AF91_9VIRU|nr:MAG: hypothetical protein Solivirus1_42 [Solivirus sp.]
MSIPEVDDKFAIFYSNRDYLFRVERIDGLTVYLKDDQSGVQTSLTWSFVGGGFWLLPNGEIVPQTHVRLIKKRAEFYDSSLTKHELADLEILIYADLQTFSRLCRLNKYFAGMCNGPKNARLYSARIQVHFPELYPLILDNSGIPLTSIDYRKLYFKIERWKQLSERGGFHKSFYPESILECKIMATIDEDLFVRPGTDAMFKYLLKPQSVSALNSSKVANRKDEIVIWAHQQRYIPRGDFIEYYVSGYQNGNLELIKYVIQNSIYGLRGNGADLLAAAVNGHVDIVEYLLMKGIEFPMPSYHILLFSDRSLSVLKYLYASGIRPGPESFRYVVSYGAIETFNWLRSLGLRVEDDLTEVLRIIIEATTLNAVMIEILKFYPDVIINSWIKNNNYTMIMATGSQVSELLNNEVYLNYAIQLGRVTLTEYLLLISRIDPVRAKQLMTLAQRNKEILQHLEDWPQ